MKTLIVTGKEVKEILTPALACETVERAFRAHGLGEADMPPKSYLTFPEGDLRSMPAYLHGQGFDMAGIKSVNVHTGNAAKGLPTVMALVVLVDPGTGFPLAVMDGAARMPPSPGSWDAGSRRGRSSPVSWRSGK